MINLLPQEEKRQLRAARTNSLLIRYNILLLCVVAFTGIAIGVAYIYLTDTEANAKQALSDNQAKVSQYASVETKANQFRQNLATAKTILDNGVTYSKVILEISQLIPSGVVLENLDLDAQTFGSETTLTAQAKDYNSALALKDSFSQSSIFSDVHFQSITNSGAGAYPYVVSLNIIIKKDAIL